MVEFLQENRRGRLSTDLGEDVLVLLRMDGEEELSGYFTWTVEALSEDPAVDLNALLGTHATVTLDNGDGPRFFDGIVTEAQWRGMEENGNRYNLVLRPWLHLANMRRNNRIFHELTVEDILTELLSAYAHLGNPHVELKLTDSYPKLEYTVQYNESDAVFAQRMMERFGITWHWKHDNKSHTLVLTDKVVSHDDVPGGERAYYSVEGYQMHPEEHFYELRRTARVTTGAVRLTEYNFKTPHAAQEVAQLGAAEHDNGQIESFDWPGDYLEQGVGEGVVQRRVDEETGQAPRVVAKGDVSSLGTGLCVTPIEDFVPEVTGKRHICLKARHTFRAQAYGTGDAKGSDEAYVGEFVLLRDDSPFRPERRTRRPLVHGPQTARVVGDGEIDCDEFGRILVQFHWDLDAAYSMRCRVSQNWASKGWGGMVIPRIGMEVVVEFLEGDPDKPLVTGCVFNGYNDVPYPLPDHKTKSVFRSDTHQGQGFNEITFEDQSGQENISLHAQKDQTLKVLNNRMKRVDNDQVESVGTNKSIEVGKNHQERIGGSMNLTVGGAKGALFGGLAAIAGQATKDAMIVAGEAGDGSIPAFLGALVGVRAGAEAQSGPKITEFDGAGKHREIAGADQIKTGTALGSVLSTAMPLAGVLTTTIEKFQSDTIGLARTEQIGAFKNTMVGAVQNTMVGAKQFTKVGQEQRLNVGKTKTVDVGEEYTSHAGQRSAHSSGKLYQISSEKKFEGTSEVWEIKAGKKLLISAPGGYMEISTSGITIRGLKLKIQGNSIDFSPGGPGEGSKCLRAMAASATPFVK
ncbi:MAG: type VI secretion system tip protein TssI/VgrG [Pseudomonadota bacterium]